MQVKVGSFLSTAGAAGSTFDITGVGFKPKVLRMYALDFTADADAIVGGMAQSYGFYVDAAVAAASAQRCIATHAEDFGENNEGSAIRTGRIVEHQFVTGGVRGALKVNSVLNDGFRMEVVTAYSGGVERLVMYQALGGEDLRKADIVDHNFPGAAGLANVVGFGFDPNYINIIGNQFLATFGGTDEFDKDTLQIGAVDKDGNQYAASYGYGDGGLNDAQGSRYLFTGEMHAAVTWSGAVHGRAAFSQYITDGYEWDVLDVGNMSGDQCCSLGMLVSGAGIKIGKTTVPSDGTNHPVAVGYKPAGGMLASVFDNVEQAQDVSTGHALLGLGFFKDETERRAGNSFGESTGGLTDSGMGYRTAKVLVRNWNNAVDFVFDIVSMDADGFTLVEQAAGAPHDIFLVWEAYPPSGGGSWAAWW